jgi:UDP-N-acetylenolpyruvoylglucosamine reductase
MRAARDRVAERFGVRLEPEVHLLGGAASLFDREE